jgi:hypothetical protein
METLQWKQSKTKSKTKRMEQKTNMHPGRQTKKRHQRGGAGVGEAGEKRRRRDIRHERGASSCAYSPSQAGALVG